MIRIDSEYSGDTLLLISSKIAFAVLIGMVLWAVPPLRHWIFYVVWGPLFGLFFVYLHSPDKDSEEPPEKWHMVQAVIIGISHVPAVTAVWYVVTKMMS